MNKGRCLLLLLSSSKGGRWEWPSSERGVLMGGKGSRSIAHRFGTPCHERWGTGVSGLDNGGSPKG